MGTLNQSLGRNTAIIQTCTSKLVFLNQYSPLTQLGSTNGCHITTGTATNNKYITENLFLGRCVDPKRIAGLLGLCRLFFTASTFCMYLADHLILLDRITFINIKAGNDTCIFGCVFEGPFS